MIRFSGVLVERKGFGCRSGLWSVGGYHIKLREACFVF